MKKVLILILMLSVTLTMGCAEINKSSDDTPQGNNGNTAIGTLKVDLSSNNTGIVSEKVTDEKQALSSSDGLQNSKMDSANTINNDFFFKSDITQVNYKSTYAFRDNSPVDQDIKLHIDEVVNLKQGKLYELKLDSLQDVPEKRLILGYFYVQQGKIYKMELTEKSLNDLKSNNVIPKESTVVCQEKALKDNLEKDRSGWHYNVDVDGDKRIYHAYNDLTATGYYESFTWEKGKGLINYNSGLGAESDSIKLQLKID